MDTTEKSLVQVGAAPSAAVAGLVAASIAENTKRTYSAALKRLDAALEGQDLTDASLSIYIASLHAAGLSPVGPATDRVLAGLRREGKGRGRGQVDGVRFSEVDTAVAANDGGSVAGLRFAADDSTLIDLFEEIVLPDDLDLDFADSNGVGGEGH